MFSSTNIKSSSHYITLHRLTSRRVVSPSYEFPKRNPAASSRDRMVLKFGFIPHQQSHLMDFGLPDICTSFTQEYTRYGLRAKLATSDRMGDSSSDAAPADQMRATGTGRRKVALLPGRSQLDWMRLSQRLVRPRPQSVTPAMLATHNTKTDAWLAIDGAVYDVTPYLEYHPGGIKILQAASGKDATALFNKFHPWVNVQSMLANNIIGQLVPEEKKDSDADK